MFERCCIPALLVITLLALLPGIVYGQKTVPASTVDSLLEYARKTYEQDVNTALQASEQALSIAREHRLQKGQCRAYLQLGSIYTHSGLYTKALDKFHQALKLAQQKKWLTLEAEVLTNLGNVYYYEDSLHLALNYYNQSLKKLDQTLKTPTLIRNYTNIGLANLRLNTLDTAEFYTRKALQISREINYDRGVCINYQNLGSLYTIQNKLDSALVYFEQALSLAGDIPYQREQLYIYQGMAAIHRKQQQWKQSKQLLIKALEMSRTVAASSTDIKYILKDLSEQEALEGNYRKALEYYQQYNRISDSLNVLAQRTEQKRFYSLLDAEQSISENRLLKANVAARELELRASRANQDKQLAISIAATVALFLAVCLTLFFFYHYRQSQKNHQKLQQMHTAIQAQARELEEAYQQIRQHNIVLENSIEERTRQLNLQNRQLIQYAYFNAHKVRGPLARILGLVNLMPKAAHALEAEFILERLDESARELDKVVHEINLILEVKQPANQDN